MGRIYTLDDATKSEYGKDLYDFRNILRKPLDPDRVELHLTDSTFQMTPELQSEVDKAWEETLKKNPDAFDAPKLRFEGLEMKGGNLIVHVSDKISYSKHNVIRNKKGLPLTAYPTPVTINALQETVDGYLLFGQRDPKGSDQSDCAVVGAGFHDVPKMKGEVSYEGDLFATALKEAREETEYMNLFDTAIRTAVRETGYGASDVPVKFPIDKPNARVITFVRGSNTDVTMGYHFPLTVLAEQVDLNRDNREFKEMLKIRNSSSNLEHILGGNGQLRGTVSDKGTLDGNYVLADHAIGLVEAYKNVRELSSKLGINLLKTSYVHN